MRKTLIVMFAALAGATVWAQYIEGYIPIPDSFGCVLRPDVVGYNPVNNKLYVASKEDAEESDILVVDGETNQRMAKVGPREFVKGMCHVESANKLYCSVNWDSVLVVDGATDQVLTSIPVQDIGTFLYNPVSDKLHCGTRRGSIVTLDVHGDSVLSQYDLGASDVLKMTHNPVNNKLYVPRYHNLYIVDAAADSLIRWLDRGGVDACYNPLTNTVFCSAVEGGIAVVDGERDLVVDVIPLPGRTYPVRFEYNPANRQVYCATYRGLVYVVDAETYEVTDSVDVYDVSDIVVDSAGNVIYLSQREEDYVFAVDGATNGVVAEHYIGRASCVGRSMCLDTRERTLHVTSWREGELVALDRDTVVARTNTGDTFLWGCCNPTHDKVYGFDYYPSGDVIVLDGTENRMLGKIPGVRYPICMIYAEQADKLYCAYDAPDVILGIDGETDSVVARIPVEAPAGKLLYNRTVNRLYGLASDSAVLVVDCAADTVVGTIEVPGLPADVCLDSTANRLCVALGDYADTGQVAVIDCRTDSIVATIPIPDVYGLRYLGYNQTNRRVYGWGVGSGLSIMVVIDCIGDSVRAQIPMPGGGGMLCINPAENKVYVGVDYRIWPQDSVLVVIDGNADTVLTTVVAGNRDRGPQMLTLDPVGNRLLVSGCPVPEDCGTTSGPCTSRHPSDGDVLLVVDCATDSVVSTVSPGLSFRSIVWNPNYGRVYFENRQNGLVPVARFPTGIAEERRRDLGPRTGATIVRGALMYQPTASSSQPTAELMDIAGRKVMDLKPGPNDIRHVAPGVYFVRSADSGGRASVSRIVIAR
jgi:DNA-binding beta-propeller fold protein YncE